jgi:hypothetical protein
VNLAKAGRQGLPLAIAPLELVMDCEGRRVGKGHDRVSWPLKSVPEDRAAAEESLASRGSLRATLMLFEQPSLSDTPGAGEPFGRWTVFQETGSYRLESAQNRRTATLREVSSAPGVFESDEALDVVFIDRPSFRWSNAGRSPELGYNGPKLGRGHGSNDLSARGRQPGWRT